MMFFNVNCFYLILVCQFMFVKAFGHHERTDDVLLPLPDVKLALMISSDHGHQHLHLKQTQRVLANEHLPVWILKTVVTTKYSRRNIILKLEPKDEVMGQLGKFTFYHDTVTNSAAVYFHQRRQFDGMIDTRYLIQGFSIDKIHTAFDCETIIQIETSGIISRPQFIEQWPLIPISYEDVSETVEYKTSKTYQNRLYNAYPEILVIVSCELAQELLNKAEDSDKYTPIISHVLTLFNGVDMLYSKLQKTNIKLNIAGIIIDNECNTRYFLKDCYGELVDKVKHHRSTILHDECIFDEIRKYLSSQENEIPIDSYDVVVFLSGIHSFGIRKGKIPRLEGSALYMPVYDTKKLDILSVSIALVRENGSSTNYATVAHALAHSMNIHHDERPFGEDHECCGNMMRLNGNYGCEGCLSWTDVSEIEFQTFLSSPDCCGFINYPRSLYAERQREALTADEQCQCYGYKSEIISEKFTEEYCHAPLQCQDDDGEVHETLIPLNGTQCDVQKVCWRRACRSLEDFELYILQM